jgi:hypothetical protein
MTIYANGIVNSPTVSNPMGSAYLGSAQNINTGEVTKVNLDTLRVGQNITFDDSNKRFIITTSGKYKITGQVNWAAAVDQKYYTCKIYVNNASVKEAFCTGSGTVGQTSIVTIDKLLAVNDYIELFVYHNAATTQGIDTGVLYTSLEVEKVG